jgi:hypothetical protein
VDEEDDGFLFSRWDQEWAMVEKASYELAGSFLKHALKNTSPFQVPGSYLLSLECIGKRVKVDLLSMSLVGAISEFSATSVQKHSQFKYFEPWAGTANKKISNILGVFEELLNSTTAKESDFQKFFETNPEFLYLLGDYDDVKSQVTIDSEVLFSPFSDPHKVRPDFFLHCYTDETWDILDIKKAQYDTSLIVGSGTSPSDPRRPSAVLLRAIEQLRAYRDMLEQRDVRNRIKSLHSLDVLTPRMILLMGKNEDFKGVRFKRNIAQKYGVDIYTYDELFRIAGHRNLSSIAKQ